MNLTYYDYEILAGVVLGFIALILGIVANVRAVYLRTTTNAIQDRQDVFADSMVGFSRQIEGLTAKPKPAARSHKKKPAVK